MVGKEVAATVEYIVAANRMKYRQTDQETEYYRSVIQIKLNKYGVKVLDVLLEKIVRSEIFQHARIAVTANKVCILVAYVTQTRQILQQYCAQDHMHEA